MLIISCLWGIEKDLCAGLQTQHSIKNVQFYPSPLLSIALCESAVFISITHVKWGCMGWNFLQLPNSISLELILFANNYKTCNSPLIDPLEPLLPLQHLLSEIQPSSPNYSWKLPWRVWHFALFCAQSYVEVNIPVNGGRCVQVSPMQSCRKMGTCANRTSPPAGLCAVPSVSFCFCTFTYLDLIVLYFFVLHFFASFLLNRPECTSVCMFYYVCCPSVTILFCPRGGMWIEEVLCKSISLKGQ